MHPRVPQFQTNRQRVEESQAHVKRSETETYGGAKQSLSSPVTWAGRPGELLGPVLQERWCLAWMPPDRQDPRVFVPQHGAHRIGSHSLGANG